VTQLSKLEAMIIICYIFSTIPLALGQILPVEIAYDDGSAEEFLNLGMIRGCYYMVYFTVEQPGGEIISVKVYVDSAEEFDVILWNSQHVQIFRYSTYTGRTVKAGAPGWCEVSLQNCKLEAPTPGLYILVKPLKETSEGYRPMVGLDTSSQPAGRSYIYFCGNKSYSPVKGNLMVRMVVGYEKVYVPPTPPPPTAQAHDIYGFVVNKSRYSTITYGSMYDYASVMLLDTVLRAKETVQSPAAPTDRPLIVVGGPIALPWVENINMRAGVRFEVSPKTIRLKALGGEWTYKADYWGWRDYAVIYFIEEEDFLLTIQGCTRYGTRAGCMMVALNRDSFKGFDIAVIEWRDLNYDGQIQISECMILASGNVEG